jgi:hypothetical protein
MQSPTRGVRRALITLGLSATALAALAPAALADARYAVGFGSAPDGSYAFVTDRGSSTGSHTSSAELWRDGTLLGSGQGQTYPSVGTQAGVSLDKAPLAAGDQLRLIIDGTTTYTVTYNGLPAADANACSGATSFTGKLAAGNDAYSVGAYTPSRGSSDNAVTTIRTGATFTATAAHALAKGDSLSVNQEYTDGDTSFFTRDSITVADCPVAIAAPAPAPKIKAVTPTAKQILAVLTSTLGDQAKTLKSLDIAKIAGSGKVDVPFSFPVPGKVKFRWVVSGATVRSAAAAKKAKTVTIAAGSTTRSTPGAVKVPVKLTKAGRKLLRHSKQLRITIVGAFTPFGGTVQQSQTKVTLKHHKAKNTKKAKKA